jgi:hypothetical protein
MQVTKKATVAMKNILFLINNLSARAAGGCARWLEAACATQNKRVHYLESNV